MQGRLKEEIRVRAKFPLPPEYDSVEELGKQMEADLWRAIDEEFPKTELVSQSVSELNWRAPTLCCHSVFKGHGTGRGGPGVDCLRCSRHGGGWGGLWLSDFPLFLLASVSTY